MQPHSGRHLDVANGVLVVCPFFEPNVGGVETHLSDLVRHLDENGHRVWVLAYQPISTRARGPALERRGNVEVRRTTWIRHPRIYHALERFYPALFCYLAPGLLVRVLWLLARFSDQIGVIHAHGLIAASVGALSKRLFGTRLVVSLHSVFGFSRSPIVSRIAYGILRHADVVLGLSNQSTSELLSLGLDRDRVSKFTYWLDLGTFSPRDRAVCRQEFGFDQGFVALFVGRLIPVKGINVVMAIAERLPHVSVVVIGAGPLLEAVQTAARRLHNLRVLGNIDNQNLAGYYCSADVVLMPSMYEEGFGRVILEALACGTPVIASRRGGIVEAVDDSVAVLVEPTVECFVEAIETLMRDVDRLAAMRARARSFAEAHYGVANADAVTATYGFIRAPQAATTC